MTKPCLGYPSRIDAVTALREFGLSHYEIAQRTGIQVGAVRALSSARQRSGRTIPIYRSVPLPIEELHALHPHAARRGIHPNALARRIVATVIRDGMIDAVLDDADELPRRSRR